MNPGPTIFTLNRRIQIHLIGGDDVYRDVSLKAPTVSANEDWWRWVLYSNRTHGPCAALLKMSGSRSGSRSRNRAGKSIQIAPSLYLCPAFIAHLTTSSCSFKHQLPLLFPIPCSLKLHCIHTEPPLAYSSTQPRIVLFPMSSDSEPHFKFYHYDPSLAGACIFAILFDASTIWHLVLIAKHRTLFFIPLLIDGTCACSSPSSNTPFTLIPSIY